MKANRNILATVILALAFATLLAALGVEWASSYPSAASGGEYRGWSGETAFGVNPRHVQTACGSGRLYAVYDNGSDVSFCSSADGGMTFTAPVTLDYATGNSARDAYIAASGAVVAVSWKEATGGKEALVMAVSTNGGSSWAKYRDANATLNNYEAHLVVAGGKIHGAYVSDASGRNEVYYRRWNLDATISIDYQCVNPDAVADSQPCILTPDGGSSYWVFYQHGDAAPHTIRQSWSSDGTAWNGEQRMHGEGIFDLSWPECCVFGPREGLVAQGQNGVNYNAYYQFYADGFGWSGVWSNIASTDTTPMYPQVAGLGEGIMMTYSDRSGSGPDRVSAQFNATGDGGQWRYVDGLFYANAPYDQPGCTDVCSDGTRFYAASAGTGTRNCVMVKKEDLAAPSVSIVDPGRYHNGNFTVSATAADAEWDNPTSRDWFLSPRSDAYQRGIAYGTFGYKLTSSSTWSEVADDDENGSWSFGFPGSGVAQGEYNLRFTAEDTSGKKATATYSNTIFIDRTPPTASGLLTGGTMEAGASWYKAPPTITGDYRDAGGCGVDTSKLKYKLDGEDWTDYPDGGFPAREGSHDYYFRCADLAGNWSSETPAAFKVKVDATSPDAAASMPAADGNDGWRKSNAAATLTLTAADNAGGSGVAEIRYAWDGAPNTPYAAPIIAPEGVHTLYYQPRDLAGNYGDIETLEVRKDITPPAVSISAPTGEKWIRGMVTVKADSTDNCEVGSMDFYMDGEPFDHREAYPWMASLDTTAWNNDYHTISVVARDAAGNPSPAGGKAQVEVFVGNNISETNNFAEGCTRPGFDTWLCLQNPGDEEADVTVNYMLGAGQGEAGARSYSVPAHSRVSLLVNNDVGPDKDVSIQVTSSRPIVSERPMYFDYSGSADLGWKGSHTAQGVSVPRQEWYLAEGCTRDGFEEWICVQNPGDVPADVSVEYMLGDGRVITRSYQVDCWQRYTIMVNQEVGPGQDVSAHVTSSVPVVVERPMYFLYQGMWDGGHNVMGAYQPECCWYFAEGCTRPGFNQWLCIQNPNDETARVKTDYMTEDGGLISKEYRIAPHSRFTINVNNDVARQHDVSTRIVSDIPVVAERPMYFLYQMSLDEGSDAMGVNKPCSSWYLAEGCTRTGFEQWVCLQNPGEREATVVLRFMLENGEVVEHTVMVAPGFRVTVRVNDIVGEGHDVSTEVMSDEPIVCERPMYATYGGDIQAADTLAGYTFEK
jgi:hypothetical protein